MTSAPEMQKLMKQLQEQAKELNPKRSIKVDVLIDTPEPAETCFERLREVYAVMLEVYKECHQAIAVVEPKLDTLTKPEMCDCTYALDYAYELMDKLRKEANSLVKEMKKRICAAHLADSIATPGPIHTFYCIASPRYAQKHELPNFEKNPELYNEVMDWLGVPDDLRNKGKVLTQEGLFETEIVKVDYQGFQDMLQGYQEAGVVLPPCVLALKTWDEPHVAIRKKEDLL